MHDLMRRLMNSAVYAPEGEGAAAASGEDEAAKAAAAAAAAAKEGDEDDEDDGDEKEAKPHWAERRLNKEVAKSARLAEEKARLERENAELKASRAAPEGEKKVETAGKTQAEIDAEIEAKANQRAAEREFRKTSEQVYEAGNKDYKDFNKVMANFTRVGGLITLENEHGLISAIYETDNPQKVLYELGKDLDRVEALTEMSPTRRAIELNKIATARAKQTSKAPDPIGDTVKGGETLAEGLSDALPTEEWMKRRNEEAAKSGRRRLGGTR